SQRVSVNRESNRLDEVEHTMLEQRSELHDYLMSGSQPLLAQYVESRTDTNEALGALRSGTAGTPDARQVTKIESGARAWERWAEDMRGRGPVSGQGTRG